MENKRKDPELEWEEIFEFQPVSFLLMGLTMVFVGPLPFYSFASMERSNFRFGLMVSSYICAGILLILTIFAYKQEKKKNIHEKLLRIVRKMNAVLLILVVVIAQIFLVFGDVDGSLVLKGLLVIFLGIPGIYVGKKYLLEK